MKKFFEKLNLRKNWGYVVATLFLFLGFLAFFSALWFRTVYGALGFDSILFTLFSNGKGVEGSIVRDYLLRGFLPTVLCCAVMAFILFFKPKKESVVKTDRHTFKIYPLSKLVSCVICYVLSAALIIGGTFISQLSEKITAVAQETPFIEANYVSPNDVEITFPKEKRNLIYIFMESMESTFFSTEQGGVLKHEIANELYNLANENLNFSHNAGVGGYMSLNDCGWTAAGMVAQSTGIPLKQGKYTEEDFSNGNFLPKAVNITNILKDNGYYQTLMVGSNAKYGNRSDFYEIHGIDKIYDLYTARADGIVPKDYDVWWGMEDEHLYKYAKHELTEIAKKDQPFAFTMLTVDTHFPSGYMCNLCKNEFDEQYENVVSCASRQVYEFVEWIKQQPFYENTTIIIIGDHTSMDNEYMTRVGATGDKRRVYNCIINSAINTEFSKNRKFTSLDMFPTTLAAMGCKIEGDRLALGVNLFSGKQTLVEQYGHTLIHSEMTKESKFYYKTFYN